MNITYFLSLDFSNYLNEIKIAFYVIDPKCGQISKYCTILKKKWAQSTWSLIELF